MNVEQIEHLISNSNIRDLMKVPNKDENLIKSLVKLTQEKKWCYQYGCTTCGALGLGANITFFAMQKSVGTALSKLGIPHIVGKL